MGKPKVVEWDRRLDEESIPATDEIKRDAYYLLGRLSTLFAELEEGIYRINSLLITNDFVMAGFLLDQNNLETSLQLLDNLYQYKEFEKTLIKEIIDNIAALKPERNNLIHGTWVIRISKKDNAPIITVRSHKLAKKKSAIPGKYVWMGGHFHVYTFDDIENAIARIERVLEMQREVINANDSL